MAWIAPYVSAFCTVFMLGLTIESLHPLSPLRPFALTVIVATGLATICTAHVASSNPTFNCFIGLYCGVLMIFEAFDHVLISRVYIPGTGNQPWLLRITDAVRRAAQTIYNKRNIGTSRQVKNVPLFDKRHPKYVPSRRRFLIWGTGRFLVIYFVLDFLRSLSGREPPEEQFHQEKTKLLYRMFLGRVTFAQFFESYFLTVIYWFMSLIVQTAGYDLFSCLAVGLKLSSPESWPPRFGSLADAYTVRQFWGVFWHQELRQSLSSNANYIVHTILRIPPSSVLLSRYSKVFFAFLISGLIHKCNDRFLRVQFSQSGAVFFFVMQVVGIIFEDTVQFSYKRLRERGFKHFFEKGAGAVPQIGPSEDPHRLVEHESRLAEAGAQHRRAPSHRSRSRVYSKQLELLRKWRPPLWERVTGYIWVALFLTWQTPFWSYPILRADPPPVPFRFYESMVKLAKEKVWR